MPDAETGTTTNTTVSGPSRGGRGGPLPLVFVLLGAVGFSASLTAIYSGMRDLMYNGGSCASGGPYAIQNECTGGQITLLVGGIFAMLIFGGILGMASSRFGGTSFLGAGLLMWAALFGTLGFNFIQLGFDPPAQMSGATGWIISGVVFWLMALGGLIPGLAEVKSFVARGDAPEPSMFSGNCSVPKYQHGGGMKAMPFAGQPGVNSWQIQPPWRGVSHEGMWAIATGFAAVWIVSTICGRLLAPVWRPSVWTWFAPDSARAKNGFGENGKTLSRPAGASKPERSPTRLSGRFPVERPVWQLGPAT